MVIVEEKCIAYLDTCCGFNIYVQDDVDGGIKTRLGLDRIESLSLEFALDIFLVEDVEGNGGFGGTIFYEYFIYLSSYRVFSTELCKCVSIECIA